MSFTEKSCSDFTDELASKAPVPGGGGASALAGALGAALGHMVGELTAGKKKYADVEEDIQRLMKEAQRLKSELLVLIEKDAQVFEPLAEAYGMPKETEAERAEKEKVMEQALKAASLVPLEIMEKCCEVIRMQREFAEKGSVMAVSDAGVGVILAKAALQGASLNVFINTAAMKDRVCASEFDEKAERMLLEYTLTADEVYAEVYSRLRK